MNRETGFCTLYQTHREKVYEVAMYYCKRPDLAEDVVQDVFASFWEVMDEVKDPSKFLFILCRNTSFNCLRKEMRQRVINFKVTSRNSLEDFEGKDLARQVKVAILKLPKQQRTALELRCTYQYKVKEIAKIMGLAVPTVKLHLRAGKVRVMQYMRDAA